MNINLIYEGKNYNFDIPNNVTIDYLKELSSKIFNSEKELLDLVYNNKKVDGNGDNTLIRDLIPEGESNAILTVQINKDLSENNQKKKKETKKSIESMKQKINNENNDMEKRNINYRYEFIKEKEKNINSKLEDNNENKNKKFIIDNIYNNKNNHSRMRLMLTNNKRLNFKEMNKKEKFNIAYIQKNGELLGLIRQFSDKIKNIYLILYNKYKISNKSISSNISTTSNVKTTRDDSLNTNLVDNSFYELALYEKKIMNYLEIQIQHYKSLLETIQNYDNNINFTKLTEFYHKLFLFIPEEACYKKNNIIKINEINGSIPREKRLIYNNSSIDLTTIHSNKKHLPSLKIKSPIIKEKKIKRTFINLNSNIKGIAIRENELKENKVQKNNKNQKINIENDDISSNNNSNKNNILDNITEKNSIESNTEKDESVTNISPIHLKKEVSNKNISEKNTIYNNMTPIKEKKLYQRNDSSVNKFKNPLDKRVSLDFGVNQNKKDKRIKEINVSSMSIKDSNFALEKNFSRTVNKNSINKYDYVM